MMTVYTELQQEDRRLHAFIAELQKQVTLLQEQVAHLDRHKADAEPFA